jgi:hypothetical protein
METNMKKLIMLALAALVAIPVLAQDDEDNNVYTAPGGKASIEVIDYIGYGYHFVKSADFTPAWSGEVVLNILKFNLRPVDVLGIELGVDMAWSNFDSKNDAFMQSNQLVKVVDFSHYVEGSIEKKHSGLDVFSLTAPLMVKGIFGKFEIGGGAFASWNISGSTYCRYRQNNVRAQIEEVKAKVNPFTYGFLASVAYDDFGVYFKYYPQSSRLLPEGSVDLSYMTLGLVIGF